MTRANLAAALLLVAGCTPTPANVDVSPYAQVMTRISSWAGMCAGVCNQEISFNADGGLTLVGTSTDGTIANGNSGALTQAGLAELHTLEDALYPLDLDPTYGCPDCADGGGMTVSRWARDTRDEISTDYPYGEPPVELEGVDALFQALITTLRTCEDSDWAAAYDDCTPTGW